MALIQISPLGFGGFTLRSLRFCLRSTEAEPRQDFGRGENLGCVYKAWRNEGEVAEDQLRGHINMQTSAQIPSGTTQKHNTVSFTVITVYSSTGAGSSGVLDGLWEKKEKKKVLLFRPKQKKSKQRNRDKLGKKQKVQVRGVFSQQSSAVLGCVGWAQHCRLKTYIQFALKCIFTPAGTTIPRRLFYQKVATKQGTTECEVLTWVWLRQQKSPQSKLTGSLGGHKPAICCLARREH